MTWRTLVLALFAVVLANAAPAAQLKPIDEATGNASLMKFRNELQGVIARKDTPALIRLFAPDVYFGYADDARGLAAFNKLWNPASNDTRLWVALAMIVDGGGKFASPATFNAPYVFAAFPADYDINATVIVTNPAAVLRRAPGASASIIRKLDHEILEVVKASGRWQHMAGPNDWEQVKDTTGQIGFVPSIDVRSPMDYHLVIENRGGRWLIKEFSVGQT